MKIRVEDIPDGGLEINADSNNANWLKEMLRETLGIKSLKTDDSARINFQIHKQNHDITLIGGAMLKFHAVCDRCLSVFPKQQQIPVHLILVPVHHKTSKKAETDIEDDGVGFYEENEIDIGHIISEQIILAQQMKNVCKDDCLGLCQVCGKNLNDKACKCKKEDSVDSPFVVLKKFRP